MPHRISREEAVARLPSSDGCALCALVATEDADTLGGDGEIVVRLSRYPVQWGHVMVVPRTHVERFGDLELATWLRTNELAHRAARAIEAALAPSRCYIASLGAARADLPMTFPHVHINVIPVFDSNARPREILTWQHGVLDGSEEEWAELRASLSSAWA
jgi:diadenosine tetraphosphate (Ap4A) HIT family hydrolase